MWEAVIGAVALVAVALLSFHGGRALSRSQRFQIDATSLVNLTTEVQRLHGEVIEMKNRMDDIEDENRLLWHYTYALIENDRRHGVVPVDPPAQLLKDEKLKELLLRKIGETNV